jgi:hypothetical protein
MIGFRVRTLVAVLAGAVACTGFQEAVANDTDAAASQSKEPEAERNARLARQRAADAQLIAKVQRDRELEAAAARKRDEDRKRATMARFHQSSCVFKPVMADADIAACRGQ